MRNLVLVKIFRKIVKLISVICRTLFYGLINAFIIGDVRIIFSCVISHKLPQSTKIPHPIGIVIGKPPGTLIGNNCTIMQNVTIGIKNLGDNKGPKIGDNVIIGSGACILGDITIGHNVIIGANSVVLKDIPNNSIAVGIPAQFKILYNEQPSSSKC